MTENTNLAEEYKLLAEDLEEAKEQSRELVEYFCAIRSDELRMHVLKIVEIISGLYNAQH